MAPALPHARGGRIAIVTTYYQPVVGGVETAARHLATWLADRGYTVDIVTTRTHRDHPRLETAGALTIRRWPLLGPRRGWNKWLAIPSFVWALWTRRAQTDLIYVVDFRGVGLAARFAGWLAGVPVIFQAETDGAFAIGALADRAAKLGTLGRVLGRTVTWPLRRAYRGAALNVCISRALEREALDAGWPRAQVVYLPHPVDRRVFHPSPDAHDRRDLRARLGLADDTVVVTFVGRLSREKGLVDLAQAWRGLPPRNACLVVVGPEMPGHPWNAGPEARELVGTATPPARFLGELPPEDVAAVFRASDFAVLPSHFEAFGIAAAEAMASGLPIVVTDVGGFRDYATHGKNGLIVPRHTPPMLRTALLALIDDAALRRRMGAQAHADSAGFDVEAVMSQCERWIVQIAGASR